MEFLISKNSAMNKQYMLLASNGRHAPKHVHNDIALALDEAKRLQNYLGGEVHILQVIGVVKKEHVPVTELKQVVKGAPELFPPSDDLPF